MPMNEHKKLFPLCGFVRGLPVGNIEVGEEGLEDVEGEVLEGVEEGVEVGEEAAGTGQGGSRRSPGHEEAGKKNHLIYFCPLIRISTEQIN